MLNPELKVNVVDLKSPKAEPAKSFEKPNIEKAEKQEIASKPDDKPKLKNKIERPKTDFKKEPKNKIQREKIDLLSPSRNKIERPKVDFNKESKNKIQREKINLLTPSRNKIERPKFEPKRESINKIQPQRFTPEKSKNKIEPKILEISKKQQPKLNGFQPANLKTSQNLKETNSRWNKLKKKLKK